MKVEETIRDDGLRIISCRVPSKRVDVSLIANVGSAYDPPGKEGLFHYFEHVVFQGTQRRTREELRMLQTRFLNLNAFTGRMRTQFWCEAVPRKLELACDLLCDLYCRPLLSPEGVTHETEVILNEIAAAEDQDNRVIYRALRESLWPNHVMRHWGAGTKESIRTITQGDIIKAQSQWYVPSNTLALAVGNVIHEEFVELLRHHATFAHHTPVHHPRWHDEYEIPPAVKVITIPRQNREKATIVFGCKFPLLNGERELVQKSFLQALLVQGWESHLWNELREKRSLVYNVGGGVTDEYPLGAYFYAYVEVLPERTPLICELVPRLLSQPLSDNGSFCAAKERFEDQFALGYEDLQWCTHDVIQKITHGESPRRVERLLQRKRTCVASTSLKEIEGLRQKTILPEKLVTVTMGPSS